MGVLSDIRTGVASTLASADGAVYPRPPGARNENPSIVVMFDNLEPLAIGGQGISGRIRLSVAFATADQDEAFSVLDTYLDPAGSNSIHLLLDNDQTLGSSVDSSGWAGSENIRAEEEGDAVMARAEILVDFIKG